MSASTVWSHALPLRKTYGGNTRFAHVRWWRSHALRVRRAVVVRRTLDEGRFDSVIVGLERRLCALAADDNLARRRSVRLADLAGRTLLIDPRTGTTTPELWPEGARPDIEETHDVDDWLTLISTGRCVGVTAESTAHQYPRPGVVYRPVRDAEPIAVRLAWWRDDAHPATQAVIELLTTLYRAG